MIRPQRNAWREAIDLSGIWRIRFDPGDIGREQDWGGGSGGDSLAIAVPGSWNEQLAEAGYMNYVGAAWLETVVFVPAGHRRRTLRFASADYFAEVWVDGAFAGRSSAAMLPFEIDVTALTTPATTARIVVRVSNELPADGPTQRISKADYPAEGRRRDEYLPAVRFDFFPYGGINRPVHLVLTPEVAISGYTAETMISGAAGVICVVVHAGGGAAVAVRAGGASARGGVGEPVSLRIDGCRLWSPAEPYLYRLEIDLIDAAGKVVDQVVQRIGIREVRVEGTRLLLNGEPVTLKGFGKHEDSPLNGRGLNLPQLVKDFGLLQWIGANSVRTSHYPYAEEFLDFADEAGLLVIDEVFSINLDFRKVNEATLAAHKAAVSELIGRDRNRPSVIAWSLSNEPGYLAEAEYKRSGPYWSELFGHARALDPSRPLTHANVQYAGNDDPAFAEADIVTVNRYHGWYSDPGQIALGAAALQSDLEALAAHGKPLFVAEFGADALVGAHSTTDQMFTEEYQTDFLRAYWEVIAAHPSCIGGHVWNFADFRTAQHSRRVIFNLKGVFTRTREPKRAAWLLRELWRGGA